MNYNSDLPGGKQATKGDKKLTVIYHRLDEIENLMRFMVLIDLHNIFYICSKAVIDLHDRFDICSQAVIMLNGQVMLF